MRLYFQKRQRCRPRAHGGGGGEKQVKLNLSALPALCHRCQLDRGSPSQTAAVRGSAALPAAGHGRARRAGDAPTRLEQRRKSHLRKNRKAKLLSARLLCSLQPSRIGKVRRCAPPRSRSEAQGTALHKERSSNTSPPSRSWAC